MYITTDIMYLVKIFNLVHTKKQSVGIFDNVALTHSFRLFFLAILPTGKMTGVNKFGKLVTLFSIPYLAIV